MTRPGIQFRLSLSPACSVNCSFIIKYGWLACMHLSRTTPELWSIKFRLIFPVGLKIGQFYSSIDLANMRFHIDSIPVSAIRCQVLHFTMQCHASLPVTQSIGGDQQYVDVCLPRGNDWQNKSFIYIRGKFWVPSPRPYRSQASRVFTDIKRKLIWIPWKLLNSSRSFRLYSLDSSSYLNPAMPVDCSPSTYAPYNKSLIAV